MTGTINTLESTARHEVLGETLRPLVTNAMGSSVEIFDTRGPAEAGPPPHQHPWEEMYVVLDGELEVAIGNDEPVVLRAGDAAHIPAGTVHRYRNVTECHFLTMTTSGDAAKLFAEAAATVEMNPPDVPAIIRLGSSYGVTFSL